MNVGTKSVLFGAHQFLIHPWFVARAWWKLYGFPRDHRLWIAFFLHDLGYFGKPNMDGPEGERHVLFAAKFMGLRYGKEWFLFCAYHSRFWAKKDGNRYSRLCVADKLSVVLEPWWFYLPRVLLSGEIHEYRAAAHNKGGGKYSTMNLSTESPYKEWFQSVQLYLKKWVEEHKDDKEDNWTPET